MKKTGIFIIFFMIFGCGGYISDLGDSDITLPYIRINSPVNGDMFGSTVITVEGSASDRKELLKVEMEVDNLGLNAVTGFNSWTSSVDTSSLSEGIHQIMAKATDTFLNTNTHVINIIVDRTAPSAELTNTPANQTGQDFVSINVGGTGVVSYQYRVNLGTWSAETSFGTAINLTDLADNTYTLEVIGKDAAGNWQLTTSATTHVWTVDTTNPVAILTGVPSGINTGTDYTISVGGIDVVSYQYRLNGGGLSAETAVGTDINLTGLTDGSYTLEVIGKDSVNNWQAIGDATTATWSIEQTYVIPLNQDSGDQTLPKLVKTSTGAISLWQNNGNIDLAKVEDDGTLSWTASITGTNSYPAMATTNTGVVVVWQQEVSGLDKIFAAKIIDGGTSASFPWGTGGVQVCTKSTTNDQIRPKIASTGDSVAIIWREDNQINSQRVDDGSSPSFPWGNSSSVTVCDNSGTKYTPKITTFGSNFIVSWNDNRTGRKKVYIEKILSAGSCPWGGGGQAVNATTTLNDEGVEEIDINSSGEIIVVWQYTLNIFNIYASKIIDNGSSISRSWGSPGKQICSLGSSYSIADPSLLVVGTETFVAWHDSRLGNIDIYIQKLNDSGDIQWGYNGKLICSTAGQEMYAKLATIDSNILVVYEKYTTGNYDVFAQRVDNDVIGSLPWEPGASTEGAYICNESGHQRYPEVVGAGSGAIVVWQDKRTGGYDIYSRKINSSGN